MQRIPFKSIPPRNLVNKAKSKSSPRPRAIHNQDHQGYPGYRGYRDSRLNLYLIFLEHT